MPDDALPAATREVGAAGGEASSAATVALPAPDGARAVVETPAPTSGTTSGEEEHVGQSAVSTHERSVTTVTRPTIRITIPDGWARAGLAGVQAALMGWAVCMILAGLTYLSVGDNPWMTDVPWSTALDAGGALWGLVLGGRLGLAGMTYTATPTLLALAGILVLRLLLLSGRRFPGGAQWFAVPGFALVAVLLVLASSGLVDAWSALPGAILLPLPAAAWAAWNQRDRDAWRRRLPLAVRRACAATGLTLGLLALASALLLAAGVWLSWERIGGIHEVLLPTSRLQSGLIITAQAAYLPTLMAWALAWATGAGFATASNAWHSPWQTPIAPLPPIPVLGALPLTRVGWVAPACCVLLGLLIGLVITLRWRDLGVRQLLVVLALTALLTALVVAAWMSLAVLHLGDGRMASLGPAPLTSAALVVVEVVGAALLLALLTHPRALDLGGRALARITSRVAPAVRGSVPHPAARVITRHVPAAEGGEADAPLPAGPARRRPDDNPTVAIATEEAGATGGGAPERAHTPTTRTPEEDA